MIVVVKLAAISGLLEFRLRPKALDILASPSREPLEVVPRVTG